MIGFVRRRRFWTLLTVVLFVFAGLTAWLFVWPSTDTARRADAVVVLAGGRGERLQTASALVSRGVATTLVISNGHDPVWREANRLCDTRQAFTVVCFTPKPNTTKGEAHAIRTLATQRHWNRVVVVTSTYHVFRARLLIERCYEQQLAVVGATPPRDPLRWAWAVTHEWAGTIRAMIQRSC